MKIHLQSEMFDNLASKCGRLGRYDVEAVTLMVKRREQFDDTGINSVLEHANGNETFPVAHDSSHDQLAVSRIEQGSWACV